MADGGVLERIGAATAARVARLKHERPVASLQQAEFYGRIPRSLSRALAGPAPRIIAEVKFSSPSEGLLRAAPSGPEAARIAEAYLSAGAAVVSILTEPDFFSGDPSFLAAARTTCPEACLLMKDFFIDAYQFELARACGADAVLLIAALLGPRLREMCAEARAFGFSTLVEVHDEEEAEAALGLGVDVLGVNSRDLRTLKTDLGVAKRLGKFARRAGTAVAESGLHTREDIDGLVGYGYKGFLIGTSLMKSRDPGLALSTLLEL